MNLIASCLLVTALSIPTTTLVLRDGTRIDVDSGVRNENGRVTFRANGALFSIPETEVDLDATRATVTPVITVQADEAKQRLKVSEEERKRLLRELEANHGGTPAPRQAILEGKIEPISRAEKQEESREEWKWRKEARTYEDAVRDAQENLEALRAQREELRQQVLNYISIGYRSNQFSYTTTLLASVEERIPYAEREVQRAQRAWDLYRDDARRQGIPPGWLR